MMRHLNESTKESRRVRFGVMCNGTRFQAWQAACLMRLLAIENVEPALLIVDDDTSDYGGLAGRVRQLRNLRNLFWYVFSALGRIISRAMRSVDMRDALTGVPVLRCKVYYKGRYSQYFKTEDIAAIRAHDLDFVIRFGFNIIRGEILEVPRYEVWSFHHDDEDRYRGGPPCFWEIYKGDPVVGSILQRLTDRLDSGIVLRKGFFKTIGTSYIRNRDRAFFESTEWPAQVCTDILKGKTAYIDASPSTTNAPILRAPDNTRMLVFLFKMVGRVVAEAVTMFFVADRWNIGIVDRPISTFLDSDTKPAVRWLPAPARNRFSADPFAIRSGSAVHVLYEDFDFYTSNGRIATVLGGESLSTGF